jgi:hypothetical protein
MEPMRQGQQNRRGRGRNRKSQNPLTRSFESNGPDIKIRGTPAHIAEKYVSLARDALSSGDPVLAENYLQHAEHYNRIIMSHREQQSQTGDGGHVRPREMHDDTGDGEDGGDDIVNGHAEAMPRGHEPQPTIDTDENTEPRNARRSNGQDNGRGRRPQASSSEKGDDEGEGTGERRPRRRERYAQRDDQPDFLKRPIRKPRRSSSDEANGENGASDEEGASGDGGAEADNAA